LDLNDLKPSPKNPRKISNKKIEMLSKSLAEFGDLGCFVLNDLNGFLVGAHQRLKTLPKDAIINITHEYDPPTPTGTTAEGFIEANGERFKLRRVAWDETRHAAAMVAANKHGGEFEFDSLHKLLVELDTQNFDLDLTGFTSEELSAIMPPDLEHIDLSENKPDTQTIDITCPRCGLEFSTNQKDDALESLE
jgi:hypothetical protein